LQNESHPEEILTAHHHYFLDEIGSTTLNPTDIAVSKSSRSCLVTAIEQTLGKMFDKSKTVHFNPYAVFVKSVRLFFPTFTTIAFPEGKGPKKTMEIYSELLKNYTGIYKSVRFTSDSVDNLASQILLMVDILMMKWPNLFHLIMEDCIPLYSSANAATYKCKCNTCLAIQQNSQKDVKYRLGYFHHVVKFINPRTILYHAYIASQISKQQWDILTNFTEKFTPKDGSSELKATCPQLQTFSENFLLLFITLWLVAYHKTPIDHILYPVHHKRGESECPASLLLSYPYIATFLLLDIKILRLVDLERYSEKMPHAQKGNKQRKYKLDHVVTFNPLGIEGMIAKANEYALNKENRKSLIFCLLDSATLIPILPSKSSPSSGALVEKEMEKEHGLCFQDKEQVQFCSKEYIWTSRSVRTNSSIGTFLDNYIDVLEPTHLWATNNTRVLTLVGSFSYFKTFNTKITTTRTIIQTTGTESSQTQLSEKTQLELHLFKFPFLSVLETISSVDEYGNSLNVLLSIGSKPLGYHSSSLLPELTEAEFMRGIPYFSWLCYSKTVYYDGALQSDVTSFKLCGTRDAGDSENINFLPEYKFRAPKTLILVLVKQPLECLPVHTITRQLEHTLANIEI